jgi:hypothetical protein
MDEVRGIKGAFYAKEFVEDEFAARWTQKVPPRPSPGPFLPSFSPYDFFISNLDTEAAQNGRVEAVSPWACHGRLRGCPFLLFPPLSHISSSNVTF